MRLNRQRLRRLGVMSGAFGLTLILTACGAANPEGVAPNQITGSCNAVGTQQDVNCESLPTPRSIGRVTFDWSNTGSGTLFFVGETSGLPTPPSLPLGNPPLNACGGPDWLMGQPTIYAIDPWLFVGLSAGPDDLVVIKSISVTILRKVPSPQGTLIHCNSTGGGKPGYQMTFNTVSGVTKFFDVHNGGQSYSIPPGSITVQGLDHEAALLTLQSMPGYLYEGVVTIEAEVNGASETHQIGSRTTPFKWTIDDHRDQFPGYTWNGSQWVVPTGSEYQ